MSSAPPAEHQDLSRVTVSNALANLVRAASGSFENIVLPIVLIAVLAKTDYSNWALVFSIAAYITYLDFGLQTATQALVARALAAGDGWTAARVARSSLRVYFVVAAAALALAALGAQCLPIVFPDIPETDLADAKLTLVLLACGQAGNLGVNVISGFYAGSHRSHITAYSIAVARCVSLALSIGAAFGQMPLPLIALGYSVPLIVTFLAVLMKLVRETTTRGSSPDPARDRQTYPTARRLLTFSGPLVLWNVCSIFVGASGTAIVGRVDYAAVAFFSIAVMLTVAITGVDNALLQPFLTNIGRSHAGQSEDERMRAVLSALRLNGGILVLLLTGSMAGFLMMARLGLVTDSWGAYLTTALMVAATALRLAMTPFNMAFLASGDHRKIIAQPVIEAILAVVGGVVLGSLYGALGVALASLASALVAVAMLLTWSLRVSSWHPSLRPVSALRALALAGAWCSAVLVADVALGTSAAGFGVVIGVEGALVLGALALLLYSAPNTTRSRILSKFKNIRSNANQKH